MQILANEYLKRLIHSFIVCLHKYLFEWNILCVCKCKFLLKSLQINARNKWWYKFYDILSNKKTPKYNRFMV